jgi:NADPH:quinone reductase
MVAIVITQPGGPEVLQVDERPIPVPGPEEVLVKVQAAGLNRPDIIQRQGRYPAPPGVPADIPGLEIAGMIVSRGKEVTGFQDGEAICALIGGGGYAQYALADHRHCLPVPNGWTFEEAASLPETIFTVWHNVFQRGKLKTGEDFLVHGGSSGIGITAIQLARAQGARVFATAGTDDKCYVCEALGAEKGINYRTHDFEEELKDIGVDVILDMVGGEYIPKNLRLLKPDGRLVFINAVQGAQGNFNALDLMRRRLTITGSTLRPRDADFKAALTAEIRQQVWPMLETRLFQPVLHQVFDLQEAAAAHSLMESSSHIGKIVLKVSS